MNNQSLARALVFSIDNHYVMPFEVLFDSLVRSQSIPDSTPIFVLHGQSLSTDAQERLTAFASARHFELRFVFVSDDLLAHTAVGAGDHVSVATYFRLFLAELLPAEVDEAVYLDADLLVMKSIRQLFELPIKRAIAAVDHFSPAMSLELWGKEGGDYFQAGVLLINLRYWREHNLQQHFMEVLRTQKQRIHYWDQCVLNLSLADKWDRLPIHFNVCHGMLPLLSKADFNNICIVHYDGKGKPWGDGYFRKLAGQWHKAYQLTYGNPFRLGLRPNAWKKALLFYLYAEKGIKLKLAFWR